MMESARYSPAALAGKGLRSLAAINRKYGAEWWILVAGALIVLFTAASVALLAYLGLFRR